MWAQKVNVCLELWEELIVLYWKGSKPISFSPERLKRGRPEQYHLFCKYINNQLQFIKHWVIWAEQKYDLNVAFCHISSFPQAVS